MAPIIGVSPCRSLPDYFEAIRRVGGEPRPLDPATDSPKHVMENVDGFVLAHGGDLNPVHYGEEQHPAVQEASVERDEYDLALVRRALDVDLPILAI